MYPMVTEPRMRPGANRGLPDVTLRFLQQVHMGPKQRMNRLDRAGVRAV